MESPYAAFPHSQAQRRAQIALPSRLRYLLRQQRTSPGSIISAHSSDIGIASWFHTREANILLDYSSLGASIHLHLHLLFVGLGCARVSLTELAGAQAHVRNARAAAHTFLSEAELCVAADASLLVLLPLLRLSRVRGSIHDSSVRRHNVWQPRNKCGDRSFASIGC
jgi:hypothetical protein